MESIVELRVAKIPKIGWLAVHYWFVIKQEDTVERWEVWQCQNVGKKQSWGHLHLDLMHCDQGVGNGASWLEERWQGELARNLIAVIQETPIDYPYNYLYRYYPGPNSNTYVQWILDQAQVDHELGKRGWGKYYARFFHRKAISY